MNIRSVINHRVRSLFKTNVGQALQTRLLRNTRLVRLFHTNSHCPLTHEHITKPQQEWFEKLSKETTAHCETLASTGLADRAHLFKVNLFTYQETTAETLDISRFKQRLEVPELVRTFDPLKKNTLFSHSEEIKRLLDIRLYPTILQLINQYETNIFLGSKIELQAFTEAHNEKLMIEMEVPSSVKFYLASTASNDIKIYISHIVSHENLIQQLITLKLAGINVEKTPILGDTQQFKKTCKKDLINFEKHFSSDLAKRNALIVSGCNLEEMVCSTLKQMFFGKMSKKKFSGELLSLTYVKSENAPDLGFIILNLNYGEICEDQISLILEKFNCTSVFSGSAAGYIPKETDKDLPNIGDRITISSAKHYSGEVVTFDRENRNLHLQVPTIFVETFDWLHNAIEMGGTSVDVETFYILRAIKKYQTANPHMKLQTDIGVFISDYVGKQPLRSYKNVFAQYPLSLQNFVTQVLVANVTSPYNNNRSSIPHFSNQYYSITPEIIPIPSAMRKEPVIDSIGKYWDKSEFFKRAHTPVTIGRENNQAKFSNEKVPRCLHLPIKLPGSDIRIPTEYKHFSHLLQHIFNFEISINQARWNDLYAYLTVDQGFVPRSSSQRVPGPHVDGIPRDRDNPEKQLIDHAYLITDAIPTMFYPQKFDMSPYDPKIHHFFAIFRALSDESRTITVNPFDIVLMNAYSVHTPTQTHKDVNRTFLRLEFSPLKFDRSDCSINQNFLDFFGYPFNYIPRPIPAHLFVPPDVYLNRPITSREYTHESIKHFGRAKLHAIFTQNIRVKLNQSDYKDLDLIAKNMMDPDTHGIVILYHGIPHAFCLFTIENKTIKLDTLFTLNECQHQEITIYQMKTLKKFSEKLALQAGLEKDATPITILIHENNKEMLDAFLRAARLAKIEVNIENKACQLSNQHRLASRA